MDFLSNLELTLVAYKQELAIKVTVFRAIRKFSEMKSILPTIKNCFYHKGREAYICTLYCIFS